MSKFIVVGKGTKQFMTNFNPTELPRGEDGIETEMDWVTETAESYEEAEDVLSSKSVDYGEEGGHFNGIVLRKSDFRIINPHMMEPNEMELRLKADWLARQMKKGDNELYLDE